MFQVEAVIVHPQAKKFTDQYQHQHIKENRKRIDLKRAPVGQITDPASPASDQQHEQQRQPKQKLAYAQPPAYAIVFPHLRRIGWRNYLSGCHCLYYCTGEDYCTKGDVPGRRSTRDVESMTSERTPLRTRALLQPIPAKQPRRTCATAVQFRRPETAPRVRRRFRWLWHRGRT